MYLLETICFLKTKGKAFGISNIGFFSGNDSNALAAENTSFLKLIADSLETLSKNCTHSAKSDRALVDHDTEYKIILSGLRNHFVNYRHSLFLRIIFVPR